MTIQTLATLDDMAAIRAWTGGFFASATALPIAFTLDGQRIHGIPAIWRPTMTRRSIDATIDEIVFEGAHPTLGVTVRVECTLYRDFPVVEWLAWFGNADGAPTPILSDIHALDGGFAGTRPELEHVNGDYYSADGYTPQRTAIPSGDGLRFAPNGGRPCDGAFPYFRIKFATGGLTLAVGWPAQWAASFRATDEGVNVQAGQERTHLRLMPGETIRTPRMTVLGWSGDDSRTVNLWRRWYLAHLLPRPNGRPLQPLLACCCPDDGEEFTAATEINQLRYIDQFKQRGIACDVWWIDAGWYPCYNAERERRWPITGTWKPDPERFPNGLKPVAERLAKDGTALLIWFEPERVRPGTQLDVEHPEWLLRAVGNENALLNLGIPACRDWLTEHVCALIRDNGIGIYRQDFNFEPLRHWRDNESNDRQGVNENLHVQGYLRYWDALIARNPGLWIDSCASGGRRNDLETMRRSVPLHYTDYGYGDHPVKLAFQHTLYAWIPYFKEVTLAWDIDGPQRYDVRIDRYAYHCGFGPMMFATLDVRRDDYDYALAREMMALWRRAAPYLTYGDYHPLTPFHKSAAGWVIRQFDQPESGSGMLQAIRFPAAQEERQNIRLKGIDPAATYRFEQGETGEVLTLSGAALLTNGFDVSLAPRNGVIWFYAATLSRTHETKRDPQFPAPGAQPA